MSTPFDECSAEELAEYVPAWKVTPYICTHHPLLWSVAQTDKPVIMSTGAHGQEEFRESVEVLRKAGCDELIPS